MERIALMTGVCARRLRRRHSGRRVRSPPIGDVVAAAAESKELTTLRPRSGRLATVAQTAPSHSMRKTRPDHPRWPRRLALASGQGSSCRGADGARQSAMESALSRCDGGVDHPSSHHSQCAMVRLLPAQSHRMRLKTFEALASILVGLSARLTSLSAAAAHSSPAATS